MGVYFASCSDFQFAVLPDVGMYALGVAFPPEKLTLNDDKLIMIEFSNQ